MKKVRFALALAGLLAVSPSLHAQYADEVISYNSGTGFATGYTNASSALGTPALGSGITPFAPPFTTAQLVSIGAGGEITLQMDNPILNNPADPYGLNFIIFANQFFEEGSGGVASGALFYHPANILIQVSPDDVNWYTLNPALAPQAGEWFPTYGGGNPQIPMNPALANTDFTNMTLAEIESLYNGSAGGTGFSLSWAQDANSNSVDLASVDYVQIDVESGVLDLDAVSVVPEPSTIALLLAGAAFLCFRFRKSLAALFIPLIVLAGLVGISSGRAETITENFTNNPTLDGWQVYGNTNLFTWDSANHVMDVTWDSTNANSYFYLPLGRTLTRQENFSIAFDLNLSQAQASGYSFELALGLFNLSEATSPDFQRSTGENSPDLVEFDYFPNTSYDYGATIWPVFVDGNSLFNYNGASDYAIYTPSMGDWFHVVMNYSAASQTMVTTMTNFEGTSGFTIVDPLTTTFTDFHVDTFSISSYQDDGFGDSVYAQGEVSNIVLALPAVGQPGVNSENFTNNPLRNGWQEYGDTNLFSWDSTNDVMDITWNSTNENSYFYLPLGTTLGRNDNFAMAFDFNLSQAEASGFGFQLALGLFNLSEATSTNFQRSTGTNSPDLVEFDYFPDVGFGPTVWPIFVDTNSTFNFNSSSDFAIYAPNLDDWYHVVMNYSAASQTMVTTMTNFEGTSGITIVDPLMPSFTDFQVDTFSISSYQDDGFGDSVYAQGEVSNVVLTLPPAVRSLSNTYNNGVSQVQCVTYLNWAYTLQRSTNLISWSNVSAGISGNGDILTLPDTNAPAAGAFYRVTANQP